MADTPRSHLLRQARTRALARLRALFDKDYQRLLDEEVARLGGEPRSRTQEYKPRGAWLDDGGNQE